MVSQRLHPEEEGKKTNVPTDQPRPGSNETTKTTTTDHVRRPGSNETIGNTTGGEEQNTRSLSFIPQTSKIRILQAPTLQARFTLDEGRRRRSAEKQNSKEMAIAEARRRKSREMLATKSQEPKQSSPSSSLQKPVVQAPQHGAKLRADQKVGDLPKPGIGSREEPKSDYVPGHGRGWRIRSLYARVRDNPRHGHNIEQRVRKSESVDCFTNTVLAEGATQRARKCASESTFGRDTEPSRTSRDQTHEKSVETQTPQSAIGSFLNRLVDISGLRRTKDQGLAVQTYVGCEACPDDRVPGKKCPDRNYYYLSVSDIACESFDILHAAPSEHMLGTVAILDRTLLAAKYNEDTSHCAREEYKYGFEFFGNLLLFFLGLSNLYTFPKNMLLHGGVCYLVPYLMCTFFYAFPLSVVEAFVGQFTGLPPVLGYALIAPILKAASWTDALFNLLLYTGFLAQFSTLLVMPTKGSLDNVHCTTNSSFHCISSLTDAFCRSSNETKVFYAKKNCFRGERLHFLVQDAFNYLPSIEDHFKANVTTASDVTEVEFSSSMLARTLAVVSITSMILVLPVGLLGRLSLLVTAAYVALLVFLVVYIFNNLPAGMVINTFEVLYPRTKHIFKVESWHAAIEHVLASYCLLGSEVVTVASFASRRNSLIKWILLGIIVDLIVASLGVALASAVAAGFRSTMDKSFSFISLMDDETHYLFTVVPQFLSYYKEAYLLAIYFAIVATILLMLCIGCHLIVQHFLLRIFRIPHKYLAAIGTSVIFTMCCVVSSFSNSDRLLQWAWGSGAVLSAWSVTGKHLIMIGCYGATQTKFDVTFMYAKHRGILEWGWKRLSAIALFIYFYLAPLVTVFYVYGVMVTQDWSDPDSTPFVFLQERPLLANVLNPAVLPGIVVLIHIVGKHLGTNFVELFRVQPGLPSYQRIRTTLEDHENTDDVGVTAPLVFSGSTTQVSIDHFAKDNHSFSV